MKTKIIPFDAKMAKDIQDGKIKGKIIKVVNKCPVRIICWDRKSDSPIVALYENQLGQEYVISFDNKGEVEGNVIVCLEVPDNEPKFKPFDRVLVRDYDDEVWRISLYGGHGNDGFYVLNGNYYRQCIPYDGNQDLVGTTDKPKEE